MGYYQGDYYAGGKGGIGSFLKGAIGHGLGMIPVAGSSLKAIYGGIAHGMGRPAAAGMAATGGIVGAGRAIAARGTAAIIKHPVLSAAAAAGAVGLVGAGVEHHIMAGGGMAGVKGFHMSKPRGGHCPSAPHLVRNRRMNVANGRALGRAVRRLHHFAKKYRKVVGFVSPHRPKGRMYFRKRKHK
jgi:hypothetical protein